MKKKYTSIGWTKEKLIFWKLSENLISPSNTLSPFLSLYIYIYMCVYICIYIYVYLEWVNLNSLTGSQKRDSLLKNKLKERGMIDVLKDLVFDELSLWNGASYQMIEIWTPCSYVKERLTTLIKYCVRKTL